MTSTRSPETARPARTIRRPSHIAGPGIFVNDSGTAVNANDGLCTLREAIVSANTDTASGGVAGECAAGSGADDITLQNAATYTLATASGATANALPAVATTARILGRDSTILRSSAAGTQDFRFFEVTAAGNLTLDRVTLKSGRVGGANCGGAIYNQGTLALRSVTLSFNLASVPGGDAIGGAICNEGALTVEDSELDHNSAQGQAGYGGAIDSSTPAGKPLATATIKGTVFHLNEVFAAANAEGGAIRSLNASLTVSDSSRFETNQTLTGPGTGLGGGIASLGGTLTVADSKFSANAIGGSGAETRRHGGGIALGQGVDATLTDTTVGGAAADRNVADGVGGGIAVEGATTTLKMTGGAVSNNVSLTSFNSGGGGAGIANGSSTGAPGTVVLDGVAVKANSCALCDGGGVFNRGEMSISGGEISSNSSLSGGGLANGSGVFGGGATHLDGVTLAGNTAGQVGGSVYVPSGAASLANSTVRDSKAITGGGLQVDFGASLTLDGSKVLANTGTSGGGGIDVLGSATLTDTTIGGAAADANLTDGPGGGILLFGSGAELTMTRGGIFLNQANGKQVDTAGGGGLANGGAFSGAGFTGGTVKLTSVDVVGNTAINADGGGVLNRGTMTVTGGSFLNNYARSGGGIGNGSGAFPGGTLSIDGTTLVGNDTASGGGGLWVPGGAVTVANSTFAGNTTSGTGGGVYIIRGDLELDNTTVRDGRALIGGGVAGSTVGDPTSTTIQSGSAITGNTATYVPGAAVSVGGGVALFGGSMTINDTTISGNGATGAGAQGGGIANQGQMVLNRDSVRDNRAASGGGISNESPLAPAHASLYADSLSIDHNAATGGRAGGMLNADRSFVSLARSSLTRNTASSDGGGLFNRGNGLIINVTISGNSGVIGAGLANSTPGAALSLLNDTIADNSGAADPAGTYSEGSLSFANTIVVGNHTASSGQASDCFGSATSLGHNLFGDGSACPHGGAGDQKVDSRLALTEELQPLADNGGAGLTHALRPSSLALDAGNPAPLGGDPTAGCLDFDGRGLPRPRDGDGDGEAICDAGAFEQQGPLVVPFGLHSIAPALAVKGAAGVTLSIRGGSFGAGAVVKVDGSARPTTLVSAHKLTAKLPASDLAIAGDLGTVLITVTQGGQTTRPQVLTIASSRIARSDTTVVTPGGRGYAASVPPAPGVDATVASDSAGGPVTVSAATYGTNPVGGTIFDSAGLTDLQVTGATPGDVVQARFYYPASITGVAEAALVLRYWTGSSWAPVKSANSLAPLRDPTDNRFGIPSGPGPTRPRVRSPQSWCRTRRRFVTAPDAR